MTHPEYLRAKARKLRVSRGDRIRLQRKSNSNQLTGRIWRCEHGVLQVAAYDTLLRARLQAWMDCLRASWA